ILDECAEVAAPQWMAQLPERLGLDLTDPLARHLEPLAHLFERVLTLFADAESQSKDLLLLRRQHRQRPLHLRSEVLLQQRLVGRARGLGLEKVSELGVLTDRRLERERLPRRLED